MSLRPLVVAVCLVALLCQALAAIHLSLTKEKPYSFSLMDFGAAGYRQTFQRHVIQIRIGNSSFLVAPDLGSEDLVVASDYCFSGPFFSLSDSRCYAAMGPYRPEKSMPMPAAAVPCNSTICLAQGRNQSDPLFCPDPERDLCQYKLVYDDGRASLFTDVYQDWIQLDSDNMDPSADVRALVHSVMDTTDPNILQDIDGVLGLKISDTKPTAFRQFVEGSGELPQFALCWTRLGGVFTIGASANDGLSTGPVTVAELYDNDRYYSVPVFSAMLRYPNNASAPLQVVDVGARMMIDSGVRDALKLPENTIVGIRDNFRASGLCDTIPGLDCQEIWKKQDQVLSLTRQQVAMFPTIYLSFLGIAFTNSFAVPPEQYLVTVDGSDPAPDSATRYYFRISQVGSPDAKPVIGEPALWNKHVQLDLVHKKISFSTATSLCDRKLELPDSRIRWTGLTVLIISIASLFGLVIVAAVIFAFLKRYRRQTINIPGVTVPLLPSS